jgi:hypothetical protein
MAHGRPRARVRPPPHRGEPVPARVGCLVARMSRAEAAAPDDSLGEAAPFSHLGRAQPLKSASIETEIGGERQHDFKNIGQFLWNARIVCRDDLLGFLDELGAQKLPVLARVSDPHDGLITLSADDLRDPVPDQLFLGRHSPTLPLPRGNSAGRGLPAITMVRREQADPKQAG